MCNGVGGSARDSPTDSGGVADERRAAVAKQLGAWPGGLWQLTLRMAGVLALQSHLAGPVGLT